MSTSRRLDLTSNTINGDTVLKLKQQMTAGGVILQETKVNERIYFYRAIEVGKPMLYVYLDLEAIEAVETENVLGYTITPIGYKKRLIIVRTEVRDYHFEFMVKE